MNTDAPSTINRDTPTESPELQAIRAALEKGEVAVVAALKAMKGAFSVDIRSRDGRKALLAVDRFAIRTMCYRLSNGQLQSAQRADALADASTGLDPQAIYDYLYFHCIPSPRTIFQDVLRLPPGHYALFDGQTLKVAPYWTPTFTSPAGRPDFDRLRDEFRQILESSIRSQLDGTTPACYLSGGTDSSTVAGMIGRVSGRAAHSFSIGFDVSGYDEMSYARLAARHFGTEHHEYYVTPADLVSGIPKVAASYDQPFGNSSAVPAYYCARMARDAGITRMLAGDGGDELFGGNVRYAKQRVFGIYDALPPTVRANLVEPLALSAVARATPGLRKVSSYVAQARLGMPARLETYNLLERLGIREVLTGDFLDAVSPGDCSRQQREVWQAANADTLLDRHLAFDWRYTLAENDLPKVVGTATLAGMNVGFPMLDVDLLEFSARLPTSYKLKGLKLRWFFKEALRGFLPDEIITKKKQGFGLPFGHWAVQDPALSRLASESLNRLSERGVIQRAFLHDLLKTHLPAHPGYYGEMVWILMMLEQWLLAHRPSWRLD